MEGKQSTSSFSPDRANREFRWSLARSHPDCGMHTHCNGYYMVDDLVATVADTPCHIACVEYRITLSDDQSEQCLDWTTYPAHARTRPPIGVLRMAMYGGRDSMMTCAFATDGSAWSAVRAPGVIIMCFVDAIMAGFSPTWPKRK